MDSCSVVKITSPVLEASSDFVVSILAELGVSGSVMLDICISELDIIGSKDGIILDERSKMVETFEVTSDNGVA